jgi:predicted AlkP superfamily phosphohydrolase/phosphomutase
LLARAGTDDKTDGGGVPVTERLRRLVPERTRERLATALLPTTVQTRLASAAFRDRYAWHRTVAFPLPSWDSGLIRLNQAGREAAGIVPPEDRDELLVRLRRLLRETCNADTGRPLIAATHTRADFPGRRSDVLPDLLVTWAGDRPAARATHRELGTWEAEPLPVRWSEHRGRSTVLLAGPGIRSRPDVLQGEPEDVAPTLLALCDVRVPSTMVGRAWTDVVS